MQQRIWICHTLENGEFDVQVLAMLDRNVSEIDLQEGKLGLTRVRRGRETACELASERGKVPDDKRAGEGVADASKASGTATTAEHEEQSAVHLKRDPGCPHTRTR